MIRAAGRRRSGRRDLRESTHVAKGAGLAALLRKIARHAYGSAADSVVQAVARDMEGLVAELGVRPADPFPLKTRFATEADAVRGCATPSHGGHLLFGVVRALRPASMVEIGAAHGYGAVYIGSALRANGAGGLITLEGMRVRVGHSRETIRRFGLDGVVEVLEGDFRETVPEALRRGSPVELVFSDGDKSPELTEQQFHLAVEAMPRGGHLFFDDIDFSPPIAELWELFVRHPRSRSAATFYGRWGLLELSPARG